MASGPVKHLFIASLGNPSPYTHTLHSAGHIVLSALPTRYNLSASYRPVRGALTTSTISDPEDPDTKWTFWQCPSYMNVSGPSVTKAYKSFKEGLIPAERRGALLVVVHDDLESGLGKVKAKKGGSHKGHNGLKSCYESFGNDKTAFWRVVVGVGRPPSREVSAVSDYVLSKISKETLDKLQTEAVDGCVDALRSISSQAD